MSSDEDIPVQLCRKDRMLELRRSRSTKVKYVSC